MGNSLKATALAAALAWLNMLFSCSPASAQDIIHISQEIYDALSTIADLAHEAVQAQTDLNYIEKQQKKPARLWVYRTAIDKFNATADKLSKPGQIILNTKSRVHDVPLPNNDRANCSAAIDKATRGLDMYTANLNTLTDMSAKLKAAIDEVDATETVLIEIQKIVLRLGSVSQLVPLLNDYFQETDALDVMKVERALAGVKTQVLNRKKFVDETTKWMSEDKISLGVSLARLKNDCAFRPTYLGCFRDQGSETSLQGRDLNALVIVHEAMIPGRCVQTCIEHGFNFASLQFGKQCFCGNSYGKFGAANNCNMACSGSPKEVCGGVWANSVYKVRP
jgi:hypothetical protein